jgi:hypothetical protein
LRKGKAAHQRGKLEAPLALPCAGPFASDALFALSDGTKAALAMIMRRAQAYPHPKRAGAPVGPSLVGFLPPHCPVSIFRG